MEAPGSRGLDLDGHPPAPSTSSASVLRAPRRAAELEGTVIAVEPPYSEPPDFDLARALHRGLLLIEFLVLPFLLLWGLLAFAGPVSFALGLLGLYLLFRFLTPSNLLAAVGLFRLFHPRRAEEQVPVQYFRVRDRAEREHLVRRKGVLEGHLMAGDEVVLWGRRRGGVLWMSHGLNRRTGARLTVRQGSSWLWLVLNLVVLAALIGLFYEPLRRTLEVLLR